MLPHYLIQKLSRFNIKNIEDLQKSDPIQIFQWLKYKYKSISNQVLFDLYSLHKCQNISTPLSVTARTSLLKQFKGYPPSYPPLPHETIEHYLNQAVIAAELSLNHNEIPIGAIIVENTNANEYHPEDFNIIGTGHNLTLTNNDICAHAEIIAIKEACQKLGTHRLTNCDLYVTIEPCLMCMGAILHSRIRRVIFGASEPKTGAIISQYHVLKNLNFNHQTEAIGPINNIKFSAILQNFMRNKRMK